MTIENLAKQMIKVNDLQRAETRYWSDEDWNEALKAEFKKIKRMEAQHDQKN